MQEIIDPSGQKALHPGVKVLYRFISEMESWEWEFIREDFSDLENASEKVAGAEVARRYGILRTGLAKIFEKYCEAGLKAKRMQDELHSGGNEPDYNSKTETILSVEDCADTLIVETQMAHNFKFKLRYELVKINNRWRIRDNRKRRADYDQKWSRWDL